MKNIKKLFLGLLLLCSLSSGAFAKDYGYFWVAGARGFYDDINMGDDKTKYLLTADRKGVPDINKITNIAKSSILDEKLGEIYPVIVELKSDKMRIDEQDVKLIPGMTCSVDIKIGKRRLIEYIISPMIRYKDEALREK